MLARAAFPAFFFVLGGFIMFLLITLSTPIIKTIYLLRLEYPNGSTAARAGVLGICYDLLGGNDFLGGFDGCRGPKFGYTFDPSAINVDVGLERNRVIIRSLTAALVVFNALAAGVAGISLFFGFFAWLCASRAMEIILFTTMFFTTFMAWLAFALDIAMTLVARNRINDYTGDLISGHIGNAFWLALAGALSLSFGLCFAGCGMFGRYSRPRETTYVSRDTTTVTQAPAPVQVATEKPVTGGRVWPWQKWRRNGEYRGTY